jgi:hypothetical protein
MSTSLILACIWALGATVTALFPMRYQMVPGLLLLLAAPVLLAFIAAQHGFWIFALGLAAFVSMFRNPLRYLWKRLRGERPERPR